MSHKIEMIYTYGWDDAGWTEEIDGIEKPLQFQTVAFARTALDEFFNDAEKAAIAGDLPPENRQDQYRIVAVK